MCNHFEAWYSASNGPWGPIPLIFTPFSPPIFQTISQSMTTSMKSLSCFGSDRPSCCSTAAGLSCIFIRRMSLYAWLQSSALLQGGCYSCNGMRLVLIQRLDLLRHGRPHRRAVRGGPSKQPRHHRSSPKITGSSVLQKLQVWNYNTRIQPHRTRVKIAIKQAWSCCCFFIISCFTDQLVRLLVKVRHTFIQGIPRECAINFLINTKLEFARQIPLVLFI